MSALAPLPGGPGGTALSWTLLHFLWQGTALAAAFFLVPPYAPLGSSARLTVARGQNEWVLPQDRESDQDKSFPRDFSGNSDLRV